MGGLAHASSATERLPPPSRFSTDGNSYGVRLENEIAAPHSRIVRSRKSRDGGPAGSAAYRASATPMTIASPELQTPWPGRFSILQV
jgi:hypothetical protein